MEIIQKQQEQLDKQSALVTSLTTKLAEMAPTTTSISITDKLSQAVNEFVYAPEEDVTFEAWFSRYEDLFKVDGAVLKDDCLVRLLVRKLGPAEHIKFCNFILPKSPRDIDFKETVEILKKILVR